MKTRKGPGGDRVRSDDSVIEGARWVDLSGFSVNLFTAAARARDLRPNVETSRAADRAVEKTMKRKGGDL